MPPPYWSLLLKERIGPFVSKFIPLRVGPIFSKFQLLMAVRWDQGRGRGGGQGVGKGTHLTVCFL